MKRRSSLAVLVTLMLCHFGAAQAAGEVTLIAPGGARAALEAVIPGFESRTGDNVKATFGSGLGTKKQVADGDAFDVFVVQPPYPAVLASGNVEVSSRTPLASVAVGIVMKDGAPKVDVSTPEAVKKLLLAAKSVTYPDPAGGAAAGVSFEKTLMQLGIADQIKAKIKLASGGDAAMALVANGEVEVGLTFLSEMGHPGIELLGPLPNAISTPTMLDGFVSSHTKNQAAAAELLKYLSSPAAGKIYQSLGMRPGG